MKIACLSGKGGAGKTFVAVNLAAAAGDCTYIDCDVEEPNGRLFLKPEQLQTTTKTHRMQTVCAGVPLSCADVHQGKADGLFGGMSQLWVVRIGLP